ncbi:uncharacterized protein PAC_15183 [Phialocephala subalpina]|uniref:Vegetative cell wall protein gp1 n=1 Tax=Phialocephala subalpina TaxID=576137 RepID=A0A1L7XJU7_9HELO|nr:uncharacterized protein PAC_15183 [Phialocephala subalpina]
MSFGIPPYGYRPRNTQPGPSPRQYARYAPTGDAFGYYSQGGFSPRYNSSGYYATADVSRENSSYAAPRHHEGRSSCYPTSLWDSGEDVYDLVDGVIYRQYSRQPTKSSRQYCYSSQAQGVHYDREESPYGNDSFPRTRRHSSSAPRRPHTTRPARAPRKPNPIAVATEADARKHRIPPGFSLKNWDPSEEPIMLLGSVFDANSLGKWIYDWTVYHHGPATPIADMAGELWLLLIQLAGKVKRAEECIDRIRTKENREMVDDFIQSGERLTDRLKWLLKACSTPMLKAGRKSRRDSSQLGKNAGTEFVDSIFGRDRELEATEKFMSSIRLWNLRFDANCEDILRKPGQ